MASVSTSHLIMFIASVIVAASVAGTVILEVNQMSTAIEMQSSNVATEVETDIAITSDPGHPESIYDPETETVSVLVKNVGSETLQVHRSAIDVLVDGRYVSNDHLAVERLDVDANSWRSGGIVEVTIDVGEIEDLEVDGDTRVTTIVHGNEDSIDFHVANNAD
ncbi:flagellin [Natrialba swarupiae]|uniref:Flagellin n=1 Tax=Natrialba swarupiae TaxID=2448032 RepID=A0A5D5APF9_9EURY|nr:flagellin [Natrialba swarupiae]TYT61642.1 flagellin [Natrialba swarupiae]